MIPRKLALAGVALLRRRMNASFDLTPELAPATKELLAAMAVQPDEPRKKLLNDLIDGLQRDGVWPSLARLYVFAAHTSQAGLLNLLNPAQAASAAGSPAFTLDRGYTVGGGAYLNLQVSASSVGTADSFSLGFWSRTAASVAGFVMGAYQAANGFVRMQARDGDSRLGGQINTGTIAYSPAGSVTSGAGLISMDRSSNALTTFRRNGASVGTSTAVRNTNPPTNAINLGRINGDGDGPAIAVAAAFVAPSMSAAQHAALYQRLNTYLVAIGAA